MRNNIKILNEEELRAFRKNYNFEIKDEYIITKCLKFPGRPTLHYKTDKFHLVINGRKITLTPLAINMWETSFKTYHLVDIQNAINYLDIIYQDVNVTNLKKVLEGEM